MESGSFFGEIGILLTGKATAYVIAKTNILLMAIKKDILLDIFSKFPEQKNYLINVAKQRYKISRASDLNPFEEADLQND